MVEEELGEVRTVRPEGRVVDFEAPYVLAEGVVAGMSGGEGEEWLVRVTGDNSRDGRRGACVGGRFHFGCDGAARKVCCAEIYIASE